MKKFLILFIILIFVFSGISFASDDKSYYGDGVSATWDDISPFLSVLYRNTPYISISNGKEVRTFYFNIELFWDLGLYVYGEPTSVQFTGTVNDFKATASGYFRAGNQNSAIGEYRYLGYSINGVPTTNSRFPNEVYLDLPTAKLVKYNELPSELKKLYGVENFTNATYMPIKDLIESPDSPIWNFTTPVYGEVVTLKQRLTDIGLFKNNVCDISLLDYGVLYNWSESGGIIRFFFLSGKSSKMYSYSTFTGPVSIDFMMKFPSAKASMSVESKAENKLGKNTFYMGSSDKSLSFDVSLHGTMEDSLGNLSDFAKKYTYTREEMTGYSIMIDGKEINNISVDYTDSSVLFDGVMRGYKISASQLSPGRNTFKISGLLKLSFSKDNKVHYINKPCSLLLTIIYEPNSPTPKPTQTSTPGATPSATPSVAPQLTAEVFPSIVPTTKPRVEIKRRW